MHPVVLSLLISIGINAAFFIFAAVRKTDTVTDLSYSLSFATVVVTLVFIYRAFDIYRLVVMFMVVAWALRLGSYLLTRIVKIKVDHRFDDMRDKPLKFARFWVLQAITVAIVLVPVAITLSKTAVRVSLNFSIAGVFLWLAGFFVETIADAQKSAFKRNAEPGFIRSGLWAWSRHPNYFGESLLWTGVYIYCLPMLGPDALPALISPVGITLLLLLVSGVPLLEKAADKKYGDRKDYQEYKKSVSIFVPWPPKL